VFFRILGPIEIEYANTIVTPKAPKLRQVAALLILHANRTASAAQLIEELWQEQPPASALTTLQTYVPPADARDLLITRPSGYALMVPPDKVDHAQFETLLRQGRTALAAGDADRASGLLHDALFLWRGAPLGDVPMGPSLSAYAQWLEEQRMDALELRIKADLAVGMHRQLIGELKSLVAANELHEWLHAELMIALHRSGRRGEAMGVYQQLRITLRESLGLEPSAGVRDVYQQVLTDDSV
jgi:DNA-binding SARP family transcriptional activator